MNPQILYDISTVVQQKRETVEDIIKLNIGEPEQKPPKLLFSVITESLQKGRITYGAAAGEPKLKEILARSHGVKSENVEISNDL